MYSARVPRNIVECTKNGTSRACVAPDSPAVCSYTSLWNTHNIENTQLAKQIHDRLEHIISYTCRTGCSPRHTQDAKEKPSRDAKTWSNHGHPNDNNKQGNGRLPFALTGGDGDAVDAVHLLHAQSDAPGRAGAAIASPPAFDATVHGAVTLKTAGEVRLAGTSSATLNVMGSLELAGGGISGQGRVVVQGLTFLTPNGMDNENASSLRNGATLDMYGGGVWSGGDLHARDGAAVVNRGLFEVTADGGATIGAGRGECHTDLWCFGCLRSGDTGR